MAASKDIWDAEKKPRNHLRKIIAVIVLLLVIVILFFAYRKLNLLIGEDIIIHITPYDTDLNLSFEESSNVSLSVSLNNNNLCSARCIAEYKGPSGSRLDTVENFTFRNEKIYTFSSIINASKRGYGRELYTYSLSCINIADNICPSENTTFRRKAIIIMDYHPSPSEERIIRSFNESYSDVASDIASAESNLTSADNIIRQLTPLSNINFMQYPESLYSLREKLDGVEQQQSYILRLWSDDYYQMADDALHSLKYNSSTISRDSASLYFDVSEHVERYNYAVRALKQIAGFGSQSMPWLLGIYPSLTEKEYSSYKDRVYDWLDTIDSATIAVDSKISSYDVPEILAIGDSLTSLEDEYVNHASYDGLALSYVLENMHCLSANNGNCTGTSYIYTTPPSLSVVGDAERFYSDRCILDMVSAKYWRDHKNDSEGMTDREHTMQAEAMVSILYHLRQEIDRDNRTNESMRKYLDEDIDMHITIINESLPESQRISEVIPYNPENSSIDSIYNLPFYDLSLFIPEMSQLEKSCYRGSGGFQARMPLQMQSITLAIPDFITISSQPPPGLAHECCGTACSDCCGSSCTSNPLILLHGHSFNMKTSAFQSTELFDGMEDSLAKDYISVGTPDDYKSLGQSDEWTFDKGIMMKPTYYITTYKNNFGIVSSQGKNGNIDTYAIRLKDIIDYARYKTGKDKVDIIAHSMGGLVVRRYMQIFKEDKIGKLILIGTPNQGIEDVTYNYCKLFGETNECDDMKKGSVFMNNLNDPSNQPIMPKTYVIAGSGCSISGVDGDGVVTVESAMLANATTTIINGSCPGTAIMHNDLLNPEKYPKVTAEIKRILEK